MNRSSHLEAASQIRALRIHKKEAAAAEVPVSGRISAKQDGFRERLYTMMNVLKNEFSGWLNAQKEKLGGYLAGIPDDKIEDAFTTGLNTLIKQEYRLRDSIKAGHQDLDDPAFIKNMLAAYTYDFILSLRSSKKLGIDPNTAIRLAQLSYRINPNRITELKKLYPEFADWMILQSVTNTPLKSEKKLKNAKNEIPRLKTKYPNVEPWLINRAAFSSTAHPDAYIDNVVKNVEELSPRYPQFSKSELYQIAAYHPDDTNESIKTALKRGEALTANFPEFTTWEISRVAIGYPTETEATAFLRNIRETVLPALQLRHPTLAASHLREAAVMNPSDPDRYIIRANMKNHA